LSNATLLFLWGARLKLYVVVEVFQLIVSGVYVTTDFEGKAKAKFKEYTGVDFDEYKGKLDADEDMTTEELLGDYDQTKIYEVDLEEVSLSSLYNDVERCLSHSLQPGTGHRELIGEVTAARDKLREHMRKMGWTGEF